MELSLTYYKIYEALGGSGMLCVFSFMCYYYTVVITVVVNSFYHLLKQVCKINLLSWNILWFFVVYSLG